jgi:hypothetical protein
MTIGLVTSLLLLLKTVSLLLVTVDVDDNTGAPPLRTDRKVFIISEVQGGVLVDAAGGREQLPHQEVGQ